MVVSTQFFPSIRWMQHLFLHKEITIEQWEYYQKQGLMNRCKVLGSQGIITLGVPLVGGRNQKAIVKDLAINNTSRWNIDTLRTIKSCYSKAPFFDYYFTPIADVLLQKHTNLLELNTQVLGMLCKWLKWEGTITYSQHYENSLILSETERSSPQKDYIQVFSDRLPFEPNLSVLDLLFCTGPQAKIILEN